MTELPPRNLLRKNLHEAMILARARLEQGHQNKLPTNHPFLVQSFLTDRILVWGLFLKIEVKALSYLKLIA